ncbi:hypothetical protein IM543_17545 [Massilia sp. UMI-21]|nr:hypothetical protein IM543_17545 [Massilia sp. UMI-21]
MKAWLLRIFLPLAACQPFDAHADAPAATPPAAARPSDEAIRAAVRQILDEMPQQAMPAGGTVLSGGAYKEFARTFSEAGKPHCMGPDALRHQPPGFSTRTWNVGFGGLFALPFWGAAIVRGKCNWNR